MKVLIGILVIIAVIAMPALVAWCVHKISCWVYDRKVAKRKAEHPALWEMFADVDEKGKQISTQYNRRIAPLKREIETILKTLDYWPTYIRRKKEKELENLRLRLYAEEIEYKILNAEQDAIRNEIRNYIEKNNIKWAKKWGW